ncbi:MAG: anti-sigma factor family protein [bacterium]
MRCEDVLRQLTAFSSGELPADVRQVVQAHLAKCPACRAALARVDALSAAGRCTSPGTGGPGAR